MIPCLQRADAPRLLIVFTCLAKMVRIKSQTLSAAFAAFILLPDIQNREYFGASAARVVPQSTPLTAAFVVSPGVLLSSNRSAFSPPHVNYGRCNSRAAFWSDSANSRFGARRQGLKMMARKSKDIILAEPCRNFLLEGIDQVANAVRVTLGPRGRNVLLEKEFGPPMIVNDGVTIARNIELKDRRHNAGAKLVQEVASTSDDRAGDGTTSTTILTAEIAKKGVEHVNRGHNPIPLQKGIQKVAKLMMEEVKRLASPVESHQDLLNIATVATSGNTSMGRVIADAFHKLGTNAATVLEDNPALEDALEFTEGYTFERGWSSPYFLVGEDRDVIEWQSPHVLVCDYKIESAQSILGILEHFVKTKEPLVLIAEDFGPDVMQTLIINKMRQMIKAVAIKAPSFGERRKDYLRDIAVATNAQLISKDVGMTLEEANPSMLGSASSIVCRKERSSIITRPENLPMIKDRISKLRLESEKTTSKFDREKLGERIAALSGGIARIMIGAATETEQKEKRLRYEDSINAVRAAMETGYVPGGGVTYLHLASPTFVDTTLRHIEEGARQDLESSGTPGDETLGNLEEIESEIELQKAGARIVMDSMPSITQQIAFNAGVNGVKVVDAIQQADRSFGFGWNAKTSKFGDMIAQGVIDPAKVVISAIEHSTSVAGLVLTTEGMMVEENQPETTESGPSMIQLLSAFQDRSFDSQHDLMAAILSVLITSDRQERLHFVA